MKRGNLNVQQAAYLNPKALTFKLLGLFKQLPTGDDQKHPFGTGT
jgi:hypothetical protein